MSEELQEQPQEQSQENMESLKNEIKNELKEEMRKFRHRRKNRALYSIGIFLLGAVIGFGGGVASHFGHRSGHEMGHFQLQKGNHMQNHNFYKH